MTMLQSWLIYCEKKRLKKELKGYRNQAVNLTLLLPEHVLILHRNQEVVARLLVTEGFFTPENLYAQINDLSRVLFGLVFQVTKTSRHQERVAFYIEKIEG